jgi:hypothetical protein
LFYLVEVYLFREKLDEDMTIFIADLKWKFDLLNEICGFFVVRGGELEVAALSHTAVGVLNENAFSFDLE